MISVSFLVNPPITKEAYVCPANKHRLPTSLFCLVLCSRSLLLSLITLPIPTMPPQRITPPLVTAPYDAKQTFTYDGATDSL